MISDKVIAISELRNNATKIINSLPETSAKYIFVHNKPKAVLVDVEWFEYVNKIHFDENWVEYVFPDPWEFKATREYELSEKEWKLEFVDAFDFLNNFKK